MSPNLRLALRAWRRKQSAVWFELGLKRPVWVFPSADRTPLDQSNVSKRFAAILDKAELHCRGLHQMRHTFASLLLQRGAPITYVSQQLGHRDSAITLRVYARWLPDVPTGRTSTSSTSRQMRQRCVKAMRGRRPEKLPDLPNSLRKGGEPPRNRTENRRLRERLAPVRPDLPRVFCSDLQTYRC